MLLPENPVALKVSAAFDPRTDSMDPSVSVPTVRIAGNRSAGEIDGDAAHRCRIESVIGAIEAAAAVDRVVAGATFEYLDCSGSVVAAEQFVVELRADDARKPRPDEGVVTDGRSPVAVGWQVDRNGGSPLP